MFHYYANVFSTRHFFARRSRRSSPFSTCVRTIALCLPQLLQLHKLLGPPIIGVVIFFFFSSLFFFLIVYTWLLLLFVALLLSTPPVFALLSFCCLAIFNCINTFHSLFRSCFGLLHAQIKKFQFVSIVSVRHVCLFVRCVVVVWSPTAAKIVSRRFLLLWSPYCVCVCVCMSVRATLWWQRASCSGCGFCHFSASCLKLALLRNSYALVRLLLAFSLLHSHRCLQQMHRWPLHALATCARWSK